MAPVTFDGVCVCACYWVNETDPVVHGLMREPLPVEIIVRRPEIAYDPGLWFNPSKNGDSQRLLGSIFDGHEKRSTSTAFDPTEYPLTLNMMSAIILPFPELTLINLNGLTRTADLVRVG
jgi:hypothetical protein